jgi:hypothetical protein
MSWISAAKKIVAETASKSPAAVKAAVEGPHILFTTAKPFVKPASEAPMSVFEAAKHLQDKGEEVFMVRGKYGSKEPSLLIKDPKNADYITKLAQEHGQDSLIQKTSNGKQYQIQLNDNPSSGRKAGEVVSGEGSEFFKDAPKDFYSQIKTKEGPVTFSHSLDFEKVQQGVKHYGPEGLKELDPSKAGSGADALKQMKYGKDLNQTAQTYDILSDKESMVNGKRYIGGIDKDSIYDATNDPKNIINMAEARKAVSEGKFGRIDDALKQQIKDSGASAFQRELGPNQKIIESFNKVPVSAFAAVPLAANGLAADQEQPSLASKIVSKGMDMFSKLGPNQATSAKLPTIVDPNAPDDSKAGKAQAAIDSVYAKYAKPGVDKAKEIADVVEKSPVGQVYQGIDKAKENFLDQSLNQMNFTKNSVTPQGDTTGQEYARAGLDMVLPGPADAVAFGSAKLAGFLGKHAPELASKLAAAHREFAATMPLANEIGGAGSDVKKFKIVEKPVTTAHLIENTPKTELGSVIMPPLTKSELVLEEMKQAGQSRQIAEQQRLAAKIAAKKKP